MPSPGDAASPTHSVKRAAQTVFRGYSKLGPMGCNLRAARWKESPHCKDTHTLACAEQRISKANMDGAREHGQRLLPVPGLEERRWRHFETRSPFNTSRSRGGLDRSPRLSQGPYVCQRVPLSNQSPNVVFLMPLDHRHQTSANVEDRGFEARLKPFCRPLAV